MMKRYLKIFNKILPLNIKYHHNYEGNINSNHTYKNKFIIAIFMYTNKRRETFIGNIKKNNIFRII